MRTSRLLSLLLVLVLLTGLVSAAGTGSSPYAIKVNRALNTVTVYTQDENGEYTVPYKAMICSTGKVGSVTPLGTYRLIAHRSEWRAMLDGSYGQYATSFNGDYLFHSICYYEDSHDAMKRESYNLLGSNASMGCVRLETIDAKWIFDNCPAGTSVTIYEDPNDPGPLGKPSRTVDEITEAMHTGWDPTDPADGNPWHLAEMTALQVSPTRLSLAAGEAATVEVKAEPENALVLWSSSDETIARVDSRGKVTALAAGTAKITAQGLNGVSAACTVQVTGELLPYTDLLPGSWYYPEVRTAIEKGLFQGTAADRFSPSTAMTRAMVVQVLYNLEGKPAAPEQTPFTDVADNAWYRDAVAWAVEKGIVTGTSATTFTPSRSMTRQELAAVLWRYAGSPAASGSLLAFTDGNTTAAYAWTAMVWMTKQGLMQGNGSQLQPAKTASRAETAAILCRYLG